MKYLKSSLLYFINPFSAEFFWKVAHFAHKFDKVLQKRVFLGIGMKKLSVNSVIREAKGFSLMQK